MKLENLISLHPMNLVQNLATKRIGFIADNNNIFYI